MAGGNDKWNGTYLVHSHASRSGLGDVFRRFTPIECERLMGFPDNWTSGISDSQRYKCLGNAVSPPVVQAIVEKLLAA
jgi:DNA (cytosine-5)-methyltransferase 1